jgi:hypothetical protein
LSNQKRIAPHFGHTILAKEKYCIFSHHVKRYDLQKIYLKHVTVDIWYVFFFKANPKFSSYALSQQKRIAPHFVQSKIAKGFCIIFNGNMKNSSLRCACGLYLPLFLSSRN